MKTGNTEVGKDGGKLQEERHKYDILDIKSLKFLCNLQIVLSIRQLDICMRSSGQASKRNDHLLVLCQVKPQQWNFVAHRVLRGEK